MTTNRWVIVDDSDPAISYNGSWTTSTAGSIDGRFGVPYLNTVHHLTSDGSASFQFSGTALQALGNTNADTDGLLSDWQCFIDDVKIAKADPQAHETPHYQKFCQQLDLPDGLHTFRIEASPPFLDDFWLDQILYIPSPTLPLNDKVMLIENSDPAVRFNTHAQWTAFDEIANVTNTTGPVAQIIFSGIAISWFGLMPAPPPNTSITGLWSIDGEEENPFTVLTQALVNNPNMTVYNQEYFTTPDYPLGVHNLSVTYSSGSPFCLDYLYVKNGTASSTSNNGTGATGKTQVGPIVGGVLGGLVLLLLCFFGAVVLRRRLKRKRSKGTGLEYPDTGQVELNRDETHVTPLDVPSTMAQLDDDRVDLSSISPPRYTKR